METRLHIGKYAFDYSKYLTDLNWMTNTTSENTTEVSEVSSDLSCELPPTTTRKAKTGGLYAVIQLESGQMIVVEAKTKKALLKEIAVMEDVSSFLVIKGKLLPVQEKRAFTIG